MTPGTNAGTGYPLTPSCPKCRRGWLRIEHNHGLGRDLVRTGRERPSPTPWRSRPATLREYRCLTCGHVGWTKHPDLAPRTPGDQDR